VEIHTQSFTEQLHETLSVPLQLITVHFTGDLVNPEVESSNRRFVVVLKLVVHEMILFRGTIQLKRVEAVL